MKNTNWLGRMLLLGFFWVFFFAAAYVMLEPLGLWHRIPAGLARAIDILTGAVLVFELFGHLGLSAAGARSLRS